MVPTDLYRVAIRVVVVLACIWAILSCEPMLQAEFENSPEGNFDALWHEFDHYYALFGIRSVDWDSLYTVYRPRVGPESTDRELYDTSTDLLANLEDGHVSLAAEGFPIFNAGRDTNRTLFPDSHPDSNSVDRAAMYWNIVNEYMDSVYVSATDINGPKGFSFYGTITNRHTALKLGYVALYHFLTLNDVHPYYRAIAKAFNGSDGVIIDLRSNSGGFRDKAEALVSMFSETELRYANVLYRNGPRRDDFAVGEPLSLKPLDYSLAGTPIAVLTTRFTASAAELCVMGAMRLHETVVVGDTTKGSFGSLVKKILPNGWEFTLSPNLVTDVDGKIYAGIGIPPDIRVVSTRAEIDQGIDAILDAAIAALEADSRAN